MFDNNTQEIVGFEKVYNSFHQRYTWKDSVDRYSSRSFSSKSKIKTYLKNGLSYI